MSGKAAATKERVLEAAEQVFAEKGFHETAMDEIVTVSGTSKGSIYFHFTSKENLFLAVMEQLGRRLIQRVEREVALVEEPAERLDVALETALRTLTRHKSLAKLLLVKGYSMGPGYAEKRQEVMGEFASLCDRLARAAAPARASEASVLALAWTGAVTEVVVRWLGTGRPDPVREALPILKGMVRRSLQVAE